MQKQVKAELAALDARLAQLPANSAERQALRTALFSCAAIQGRDREPTLSVSHRLWRRRRRTHGSVHVADLVLLALAGGFVLGSVAALALETFIRPVRDRAEVLSMLDLPVLATIPRVRKRGGRDLLPWNLPPVALGRRRADAPVRLTLGKRGPGDVVTSAGAGDGKTTVAAAGGAAFAEVNDQVVLMDLDMRGAKLLARSAGPDPDRRRGRDRRARRWRYMDGAVPVAPLPGVELWCRRPRGDLANLEAIIKTLPAQIAQAKRNGACVIIDTAPVGGVSEALRMATVCDQVVDDS